MKIPLFLLRLSLSFSSTTPNHQIYAIEARSPAEGAYSEGFADAKLTQDFCIECPTTKTLFSLKTGEIVAWYPTNPILRAITPKDTCRALDIFPVKMTQEAISVDASGGSSGGSAVPSTRGGADSSIDRNNVYAISPKTYTSDDDFYAPAKATGASSSGTDISATAATITSAVAVAAAGAAGTAVAIYKDLGVPAIVAVWVAVGAATFAYSRSGKE
jgi:nitrite reductase/ring-hydroxylating ferredoxin subunit